MANRTATLRALNELLQRVVAHREWGREAAAAAGVEALRLAAGVSADLAVDTLLALLDLGLTAEELAEATRAPGATPN